MKITCKYCGIVNKPHKCPRVKRKDDSNRSDKKLYRTSLWQSTRQNVLDNFNNICLWSLYVDGVIRSADVVHHIVEVLEDESLAFEDDNLIPLEYYNHKEVHELYKRDKAKVQGLLRLMTETYSKGDKTLGKYKNYL